MLQNCQEITCDGVSFYNVFKVFLITSFLKTPTQVFFCQFYKIFENIFFTEYFRATAFEQAWCLKNLIMYSYFFLIYNFITLL